MIRTLGGNVLRNEFGGCFLSIGFNNQSQYLNTIEITPMLTNLNFSYSYVSE